jgi:adenylyl-sulfate kinase
MTRTSQFLRVDELPTGAMRSKGDLKWQESSVTKRHRSLLKEQKPCCVWFTGLSGAGKTTLANLLDKTLYKSGHHTFVLDGDRCRDGICSNLGFTPEDRTENVRRVAEAARLMVDAGLIVLVSLISPLISQRESARKLFERGEFLEIFLDTPLALCERRDAKGLYKKARAGLIPNFTGISSAYETPEDPEITLDGREAPDELVRQIVVYLSER